MGDPEKLSDTARRACRDPESELRLSLVSVWEIQIKLQLGRIDLEVPLATMVESQLAAGNLELLPIELDHVLALEALPSHHGDPFDRLLISQARKEDAHLVTRDSVIPRYPVKILW